MQKDARFAAQPDLSNDQGDSLVLFEDDDILVVNKPCDWNTHAAAPHAGEGIYDWLRNRQPRWAGLAIIHRLDKQTSGVLVFGKSRRANQSLTEQFASRGVAKTYRLRSRGPHAETSFTVDAPLRVQGGASRPAATRFEFAGQKRQTCEYLAFPLTGRTHQVRIHAAAAGIAVLGDDLYGDTSGSTGRLYLHAETLKFRHPADGRELTFNAAADFDARAADRRAAVIAPALTDSWRLLHGAADGTPGIYADMHGDRIVIQSAAGEEETAAALQRLSRQETDVKTIYVKELRLQPGEAKKRDSSPQLRHGAAESTATVVRENGVRYELRFDEGYSVGIFGDQRDNRRRVLSGYIAPDFQLFAAGNPEPTLLNAFAYTCAFSVCGALAGAQTVSLDLSRKYLDWGRANFALNGLATEGHEFLYGDVFDWLRMFGRRGRRFDAVILDPPTFSRSKRGVFRAARDMGQLVEQALAVLNPGGVLLASSNAAKWRAADFVHAVQGGVNSAGRNIQREHYQPQPPDFPITRSEPAYLKTLWLQVE